MKKLEKILYAEDELDVQIVVETIVTSLSDYEIKMCDNGKILLENVEEINPDLIILDVMMPEMDGPTTHKHLQQNYKTKDIPVIFMTAKAQIHEVKSFEGPGVIGVITKPFDPMQLCNQIEGIWKRYKNAE